MYKIGNEKPSIDVKTILARDCYLSCERENQPHLLRKNSLKALEMQKFDIGLLKTFDVNYYLACEYANLIYESNQSIFIGLYEDDRLKAHTVLSFKENNVYVLDIVIPDNKCFIPLKDGEDITPAYLMYNTILDYIDAMLNDKYEYIYFMSNNIDTNSEIALLGHEYVRGEEQMSLRKCYVKQVVRNNARNLVN